MFAYCYMHFRHIVLHKTRKRMLGQAVRDYRFVSELEFRPEKYFARGNAVNSPFVMHIGDRKTGAPSSNINGILCDFLHSCIPPFLFLFSQRNFLFWIIDFIIISLRDAIKYKKFVLIYLKYFVFFRRSIGNYRIWYNWMYFQDKVRRMLVLKYCNSIRKDLRIWHFQR